MAWPAWFSRLGVTAEMKQEVQFLRGELPVLNAGQGFSPCVICTFPLSSQSLSWQTSRGLRAGRSSQPPALYDTTVVLHIDVSVLELEFPGRTPFPGKP